MIKAIFLDRDDTIIEDKQYLNDPEQIVYLPEALLALKKLYDAGFALIIVSNQSGIAKGIISEENLTEIHRRIKKRLEENKSPVLDIYYSAHDSDSNHPMRKPQPGMLLAAAKKHNVDMSQSWMIGDKISDVQAGKSAGCKTILFYPYKKKIDTTSCPPDFETNSLIEASLYILK